MLRASETDRTSPMNLHSIIARNTNTAVWVSVTGGNGAWLGNHLWKLDEGHNIYDHTGVMPTYRTRTYWVPMRYLWRAYEEAINEMFEPSGWVQPLCGKRSASRFPRARMGGDAGCRDCDRIAREQGILCASTHNIVEMVPAMMQLAQERAAWELAGRQDNWSLSNQTPTSNQE